MSNQSVNSILAVFITTSGTANGIPYRASVASKLLLRNLTALSQSCPF
jgi:hypothetical protein